MKKTSSFTHQSLQAGDAAVNGLFGGLVAGLVMSIVLVTAGLANGMTAAGTLELFAPVASAAPLAGLLTHLAVSAIYGLVFGILWHAVLRLRQWTPNRWQTVLAGAGYGLLLWLAAQAILLPSTGAGMAALPEAQLLLAHLVYGVVLSWNGGR
jgi:hypothetical protein